MICLIIIAGVSILYKKPKDLFGTYQTEDQSAKLIVDHTDPHSFSAFAKFYHDDQEENFCIPINLDYIELCKISETVAKDGHIVRGRYVADKIPYQLDKNKISFTFEDEEYILIRIDSD